MSEWHNAPSDLSEAKERIAELEEQITATPTLCRNYEKRIEGLEAELALCQPFIGAGTMSDAVTKVSYEAAQLIQALMRAENYGWFGTEPTPIEAVKREVGDIQDVIKELNLCMKHLEGMHEERD